MNGARTAVGYFALAVAGTRRIANCKW